MSFRIRYLFLLFALLSLVIRATPAQQAGEAARIQGVHEEDVYAAGGTVDVLANVTGDVVVAGGRITVSERVSGDVMAAGGSVSIRADVSDDVRLAGGDVDLSGTVGDDAIAAGGNITLAPGATVGGRAWFSGGRIDIAGTVGRELRAAGGRIVISGRVNGDVTLRGSDISILDSAVIDGNLLYHSAHEAEIAAGAQISGTTTHVPVERHIGAFVAAIAGAGVFILLSVVTTGAILFLLLPRVVTAAVMTMRGAPWRCLGLGLAVFAATPLVIGILFTTVIGVLPAIILGALYLLLLLAGFLSGLFLVASLGPGLPGEDTASRSRWLWLFAVASTVVLVLALVPLLGGLLLFVVMLLGAGALLLGMYRQYTLQAQG